MQSLDGTQSQGNKEQIVCAIGMLGVGKSTLLNCALNLDDPSNTFVAKNAATGVTQDFTPKPTTWPNVVVLDTPGLCDPQLELPLWTSRYNEQMAGKDLSLVIFIVPPMPRVSANEKMLAAVADEAFKAMKTENMLLVVNRAGRYYTRAKALENYEVMRKSVESCSLPPLTEDRILVLPDVDCEP